MRYTFHKCQCHSKCPDLTGWYLELRPDDLETVMKIHRGVMGLYYAKFGMDPHIDQTGPYNPIKLGALWLQGLERYLLKGETILVNVNGGMMPLNDTVVLETMESDNIDWDIRYDDEIITISRWPEGKHYYLCSNKCRMFVPDKYVAYALARTAALHYVPIERIKSNV